MRAWRVHELGDPVDVLRLEEVSPPVAGPGEVVIAVAATSLNFADILFCQGKYQEKLPLPFTPGLEVAGTITALGEGVAALRVGQRVMASPVGGRGGLADQTLAREEAVLPIPDTLGWTDAAALHTIYQTGHIALHRRAGLLAGETLLVHAGAGGVGSAAIQLGRAAGARVIATAGGPDKTRICREQGAEIAIDYLTEDFGAIVKEATDGAGADVIYDPVGGDTFDRSLRCLAFEGRLLVIGFTGGRIAQAPTNHALIRNYAIVGVNVALYPRRLPAFTREVHADLMRLHAEGAIKPLIFKELPLEEARNALALLGNRGTYGKVVTIVDSGQ